ncbi:unnamed protein product [Triticum turgidum subsp. durum]|uniref:WAT1-related protein n=1 Tax=Triticum turgidum subsp. durum TaxID=4567 RepID=A0A9R0Z278_TRITD|nr:unnamed protein product [Triticum turgidum subsp. durum]
MVATNIVIAVMTALLKQALNQGMNRLVLITFRQMLATVFLGPIAYFKERKTRPKITAEIFAYLFLSGILGPVLLQYTLFVGLEYTTATFAATFGNLLPVVTFLISLAFGYEALEGVVASGVGYLLLTYCVEKRGPVFTAAFSPLAQMFVAGIDLCVLHEPLYLGSVLGSVLVILGLYLVLWGKREEAAVAAAAAAPAKRVEVAAAGHGDVAEQQERV